MATTAAASPTSDARRTSHIAPAILASMQSLARRIQVMLPAEPSAGHVVGVTSCSRHEGVSIVAANLAICAADLPCGKVLLVDANLASASVATRFGIQPAPGLYDCLHGDLAVQECIATAAHANLFVLPAGTGHTHMPLLVAERATELFQALRRDYELVIVDLPHIGEMDEMILASQLIDGYLLVLESERVRRQVAQRLVRQLEQFDARLLGVVLNKRKDHIPEWLYRRL